VKFKQALSKRVEFQFLEEMATSPGRTETTGSLKEASLYENPKQIYRVLPIYPQKVKDENTKNLNLEALSSNMNDLNKVKSRLESVKSEAFDDLYAIQEAQKEQEK
jgi:hypothetical protein